MKPCQAGERRPLRLRRSLPVRDHARDGVLEQQVRGTVRRHHARLIGDAKALKRIRGGLECFPVRPGAHDDTDTCLHRARIIQAQLFCRRR